MQTIEDIPPAAADPAKAPSMGAPSTGVPSTGSPAVHPARLARILAAIVLFIFVLLATAALLFTNRGQVLMHNPRQLRGDVTMFVAGHAISAPLLYLAVYILLGVLALPVWWLQILGGMAFGLPIAVAYTQTAATIGAVLAARFSHWLAADWFHKLEDHLVRLRSLDETFGRNGLLVVMAVRLSHVLPFGLSNYAFGLTTMRTRDVAWGTLLGGLPAACTYVAMGTGGHPLSDWRYVVGIVLLNAILLVPLLVHYLLRSDS